MARYDAFTVDEHFKYFSEFLDGVIRSGGAVTHNKMAMLSAEHLPYEQQVWRGGCYASTYNFASAEAIWMHWDPENVNQEDLSAWLRVNWRGILLRTERKSVRNPDKLAECLVSYRDWSRELQDKPWFYESDMNPLERYETAWQDVITGVKYMGRYITMRYLEYLKRVFDVELTMPDIRPRDGSFPRKSLTLMYPEASDALLGGNSPEELSEVNRIAADCMMRTKANFGVGSDYYTMQAVLCEYNKSASNGRQYPGRSMDTELRYLKKVHDYFPYVKVHTEAYKVRFRIAPVQYIGELNGWDGTRKELESVLPLYRYTWDDSVYDYRATTDLSNPVRRERPL